MTGGVIELAREPGKPGKPAPDEIDVAVGARIRQRRLDIGLPQGDLARALGVSFQQLQKYERGRNRVSASTLVRAALALQTTVSMLVEDEDDLWPAGFDDLLAAYRRVGSDERRATLLQIVRIFADLA